MRSCCMNDRVDKSGNGVAGNSSSRTVNHRPAMGRTSASSSISSSGGGGGIPGQFSRRSSEDSTNDDSAAKETKGEVRELEEKFRMAMINNAQLDNEKSTLTYQVDLLKDSLTDLTESHMQLKKEHKKKCSEHEQLKKVYTKLQEEARTVRRLLEERDQLIQEYGLVLVGDEENGEGGSGATSDNDDEREETEEGLVLPRRVAMKRVLLSQEAADMLDRGAAAGSLESRLRNLVETKNELEDEVRRLNIQLEELLNSQRRDNCYDAQIQKEANKTVNEYKFRVQKAEAEVSTLQANVTRLDALVSRYKSQAEELEKSEEELKSEKRRLQRELREAQGRLEEIETINSHLERRFDKLKNARSTLLKDLSQDPL